LEIKYLKTILLVLIYNPKHSKNNNSNKINSPSPTAIRITIIITTATIIDLTIADTVTAAAYLLLNKTQSFQVVNTTRKLWLT